MSRRQTREPDEEARVARAEADRFLDACDPALRIAEKIQHRAQYRMRRRKARIELDRFLELGRRLFGSAGPHADQREREMRVRVTGIEGYRPLPEFERLLIAALRIVAPA